MGNTKGYPWWVKYVWVPITVALIALVGVYVSTRAKPSPPTSQQSGSATNTGSNGNAGVINNQGDGNTNIVGSGNHVNVNPPSPKLSGWLTPAADPIAKNACGLDPPKGTVLLLHGSSASLVRFFPRSVVQYRQQKTFVLDKDKYGRVALTAEIFGADGKIIAKIDGNRFVVNQNNYFDMKSDSHSLQVFDQQNQEVIYVRYMNPREIRVRALLYFPGRDAPVRITDASESINGDDTISGICLDSMNAGGADYAIKPNR